MDKVSLGVPSSKANVSAIDRRRFLKTTAGAAAGIAGSLSSPYVNAQSGVTLRILNAETTAASQSALRDACSEYESKFGVKIVVDSTPISSGYASATCLQKRRSFMTTSGTSLSMRRRMPGRPAVFSIYMPIFIKRCRLA